MKSEVFVLGGGPSLKDFDFHKLTDRETIVTNKSILEVSSPSYFISVDYTFPRKIGIARFGQIKAPKIFVADFSHSFLTEKNGQIVDERFNLIYHLNDFNVVVKSYRADGIGYSFDDFRTGLNSGFCALQLAVILGYEKIYLLGVDLTVTDRTHFHSGYGESLQTFSEKLRLYENYFRKGLLELSGSRTKVISCSPTSNLNDVIPYKNIEGVL
jgi:hypothetical protein